MDMANRFVLRELLTRLAESVPHQQRRLDEEYMARMREYKAFLAVARAQGLEMLALEFAPSALRVSEVDLDLQFRFARSRGQSAGLAVEPLNLGYQRRYGYSESGRHRLQIAIRQIPLEMKPKSKS